MRQIGLVNKIDGDNALIIIKRATACGEHCASCRAGCVNTKKVVIAKNTVDAKVGDTIILDMPDADVIRAAVFVYMLPLFFMIVSYIIGYGLLRSELKGIFLAFGVMIITFFFVKLFDLRSKKVGKYQITIVKVLQ